MVNSLAVAAAFCASASAFITPTPLARTAAPQQSGVSLGDLEFLFWLVLYQVPGIDFCGVMLDPCMPAKHTAMHELNGSS